MKPPGGAHPNFGRRLTLSLILLIAMILGGNGLVILQFERARLQSDRLSGVSQQLIAVLRLREGLLSFHQRLDELARSRDAVHLATEFEPLRAALLEHTRQTRKTLSYLPADSRLDPAFLTALDAFDTTLPQQLQDIAGLASVGDWGAVRLRLDNEFLRIENTTSALVKNVDQELASELPRAVDNMRIVQRRILLLVPLTAIATALTAAFFGWAIARRILELRTEERVRERTRIARELHDTLLQSFQGILMKFHSVTYALSDRPEARDALELVIEQARQAINEGRDTVANLRSPTTSSNDLAQSLGSIGEYLAADAIANGAGAESTASLGIQVEGAPKDLVPLVRDEVYRIAVEALRNAFRHARAKRIMVEIHYDRRRLRLLVHDDGRGIDQSVLEAGRRPGHHGLPGMRERASLVGGELTVRSKLDSGAEIELTIPGSIAYAKSQGHSA